MRRVRRRRNRPQAARTGPGTRHLVVGRWGARFGNRALPCSVGRGGIVPAADKREGDLATPAGQWRLLWLYWRADRRPRPATGLPGRRLGPQQGWAEDPDDPAYNGPIRHPHPYPADRMARGDGLYDLCVVTDHNSRPVVPGAGSAIFVHHWRRPRAPTAGCVAVSPACLRWILAGWRPQSRLMIRG